VHYLRTKTGTNFEAYEPFIVKFLRVVLFFIPEANPGYRGKMHLVKEWLIEFDEKNGPWREIGLDNNGEIILAGPDEKNYGFWLDQDMTINDFEGEEISEQEFEKAWATFFGGREVAF